MLKETGAPTKLESLRCQLDPHHKFRQDSEKFPNKKIQRFRTTLKSVLKKSRDLGYISSEEWDRVNSPKKAVIPRAGERIVSHGEFRALLLACQQAEGTESVWSSTFFITVDSLSQNSSRFRSTTSRSIRKPSKLP